MKMICWVVTTTSLPVGCCDGVLLQWLKKSLFALSAVLGKG